MQRNISVINILKYMYILLGGVSMNIVNINFNVNPHTDIAQGEELLKVLLFAVQILQRYVGLEWESLSTGDHILLSKFLSLTLQVLSWDFQHHSIYQVHVHSLNMVHSSHVILKPPKSYASTFLDPSFLYLFFQLFSKVDRANMIDGEAVMHNVVQCLSQLASLTKPVFDNDITQQTYVVNFVSGILECVSSR